MAAMEQEPELDVKVHARQKTFKKTLDAEDGRRAREETTIQIRKQKKDLRIKQRRFNSAAATASASASQGTPVDEALLARVSQSHTDPMIRQRLEELPQMVAGVMSANPAQQVAATAQFRKLLSIERNPPIQGVIDVGVVPRLVEFLGLDSNPSLQFEAAWALTNIASGTSNHTDHVIQSGAVPIFVRLLQSPNDDVREQAVWAIGNIAGDSPSCRDLVLNQNALQPLLVQLQNPHSKLSMLRNATWTLSNFCRGKPQPSFHFVRPALPTLSVLIHSTDDDVLTDACWALSYLSDGPNEKIQAVIEQGVCGRLVELLSHPNQAVQTPALRTIGNIVTGDDLQTQCVLNARVLPSLLALLSSTKRSIRKETCWTISNITAGNRDQIDAVMQANIIPQLVHQLAHAEFDIRKEAAWAISNATSGGTAQQIKQIVAQGCIAPLCELLSVSDSKIVTVALEGLENILKVGENDARLSRTENRMSAHIEEALGVQKLEALQEHENVEIYDKAVKLLQLYFEAVEDTDGGLAPERDGDMYAFGAAPPSGGGNDFDFSQGLQ